MDYGRTLSYAFRVAAEYESNTSFLESQLTIIIDVRTVKFDHHALTIGWGRGIYLTQNYIIVFPPGFD